MHTITYKLIIILILVIVTDMGYAQSFDDIFNASYSNFIEIDNSNSESAIKSNRMNVSKFYMAGPPIALKHLRIIYNAEHKWYQNNFKSRNAESPLFSDNIHDIRLTTIFNYKVNSQLAINYVNFSTIKTDFKNFNFSNAYKSINALSIGFHVNGEDNLRFGLGAAYSKEMGDAMIVPVGFLYFKNNKWLIDLMYPRLNVFYKPFAKIEIGFIVNYDIGAFDVDFNDKAIANMDIKPAYQTMTNLTFTPQISYYIKKHFNIYARLGFNIMSEQALTDKHFNEIEKSVYNAVKISPTIGIGISIKIPH
ncbi:DUF6268 family outer membrane beta-barrel protein [Marinifilum sp. D714]|uniref:DUF6268 family outer membrane beta-barrel protein n=1 Tax=Marinifilum sp. D714 TaxID=2937523 RepID=UPI0027CDF233|nr:DUF6268 family outer membrane beta-barrel protein [Marinifilum sp. D714]MDQ2179203.1 DUF6268 family outer membrane beta-barrel protein [Marinifilum sp. D714]